MEQKHGSLFELEGRPRLREAFPLAMQHVVAMIVGCITPAIIVAASVKGGLSNQDKVYLIQASLVMSAVTTLIQLFPIGRKRKFAIGSGLPVMMGISFAYVPSMQMIAARYGISAILGAEIAGALVAIAVGFLIKKIRLLVPPLVTGTVVFSIGLSLYPTAVQYMAGGVASPTYGHWKNWLVAVVTMIVVLVFSHFGKGIWKLASILIGIVAGYLLAIPFGMVDFSGISEAGLLQIPTPMHFGIRFEPSACAVIMILFAINCIEAIGDYSATTVGAMDREPEDRELKNGIVGYGLTNVVGAFFGGLPTASFSQNVGIVTTTKVINRFVLGLAAVILGVAGLLPKFSAVLTTIPQCVLGGATISVFASIAMTGIELITSSEMSVRNKTIVGLSVAIGIGACQASGALSGFPEWAVTIFGESPVVLAALVSILLNQVLPEQKEKTNA